MYSKPGARRSRLEARGPKFEPEKWARCCNLYLKLKIARISRLEARGPRMRGSGPILQLGREARGPLVPETRFGVRGQGLGAKARGPRLRPEPKADFALILKRETLREPCSRTLLRNLWQAARRPGGGPGPAVWFREILVFVSGSSFMEAEAAQCELSWP